MTLLIPVFNEVLQLSHVYGVQFAVN